MYKKLVFRFRLGINVLTLWQKKVMLFGPCIWVRKAYPFLRQPRKEIYAKTSFLENFLRKYKKEEDFPFSANPES
jgi:hypothetical protein